MLVYQRVTSKKNVEKTIKKLDLTWFNHQKAGNCINNGDYDGDNVANQIIHLQIWQVYSTRSWQTKGFSILYILYISLSMYLSIYIYIYIRFTTVHHIISHNYHPRNRGFSVGSLDFGIPPEKPTGDICEPRCGPDFWLGSSVASRISYR